MYRIRAISICELEEHGGRRTSRGQLDERAELGSKDVLFVVSLNGKIKKKSYLCIIFNFILTEGSHL